MIGRYATRALAAIRRSGGILLFDVFRGVETSRRVSHEELGFVGTDRVNYRATGWRGLKAIFRRIPTSSEDVFVDFGSGKGRVVLEAATYPFKRVTGVEISPALHEIAAQNVRQSRRLRRCGCVELVNRDVLEYSLPADLTVAFFFNPFRGEIFATVAQRLVASVECNPRQVTIVYVNPQEEQVLFSVGAQLLERIGDAETPKERAHSIGIYVLKPSLDRRAP